jgi:hypothetical protein
LVAVWYHFLLLSGVASIALIFLFTIMVAVNSKSGETAATRKNIIIEMIEPTKIRLYQNLPSFVDGLPFDLSYPYEQRWIDQRTAAMLTINS